MPNLSALVANPDLFPRSTGVPKGIVPIPVEGMPHADPSAGQAIGRAIEHLGAGISQGGAHYAQQQHYEQVKQSAQAKLEAENGLNSYTPQMDTFEAESRQNPDYTGHPQRVAEHHKQLLSDLRQQLHSPQAQQEFDIGAGKYFSALNRVALKYQEDRLTGEAPKVAEAAGEVFERGVLDAPNAEMAQVHLQKYHSTLQGLVDTGLMYPAEAMLRFEKKAADVMGKQTDSAIAADPQGMLTHLTAWNRGETVDPARPTPPKAQALEYIKKAEQQVDEGFKVTERQERHQEKVLKKGQESSEIRLTNAVVETRDVTQLQTLRREVLARAADRTSQGLSDDGQRRLLSTLDAQQARIESGVATGQRQTSDPTRLRAWERVSLTDQGTRTPSQIQALRLTVLKDLSLTPNDAARIGRELGRELDESHVSKITGYSDAVQLMDKGFKTGNPFDPFDEEGVRQEVTARQIFRDRVDEVIQTKGRRVAEQAIPQLVDQVMLDFSTRIMGKLRERLAMPPNIPPGHYRTQPDVDSLNDTDITSRYLEGVTNVQKSYRDGTMPQPEAAGALMLLEQRKKWELSYWQNLRSQGKGKPSDTAATPAAQPSWLERTLGGGEGALTGTTGPGTVELAPPGPAAPPPAPTTPAASPADAVRRFQEQMQQALKAKKAP